MIFYLLVTLEWPCFRIQMSSGSLKRRSETGSGRWRVANTHHQSPLTIDFPQHVSEGEPVGT